MQKTVIWPAAWNFWADPVWESRQRRTSIVRQRSDWKLNDSKRRRTWWNGSMWRKSRKSRMRQYLWAIWQRDRTRICRFITVSGESDHIKLAAATIRVKSLLTDGCRVNINYICALTCIHAFICTYATGSHRSKVADIKGVITRFRQ